MRTPSYQLALALFLVGALTWEGLRRYDAYLINRAPYPSVPSTQPAPMAKPAPAPTGPSEATPEEIAGLQSSDPVQQLSAARAIRSRRMTAQLATVVDAVLAGNPAPPLADELACLKSRFPGTPGMDFIVSRLPVDLDVARRVLPREQLCLVESLAERAAEDPAKAGPVLIRAAMDLSVEMRELALRGLRKIPAADALPDAIVAKARFHPSEYERDSALKVAIALGATEHRPEIVESALMDRTTTVRSTALWEVQQSRSRAAARILARQLARHPGNRDLLYAAGRRQDKIGDLSQAFVEIASDADADVSLRQAALANLAARGDRSALPLLKDLNDIAETSMKPYVAAAIADLERRAGTGNHVAPVGR